LPQSAIFRPALQKCEDAGLRVLKEIGRCCGLRLRQIGRMLPMRVATPLLLGQRDAAGTGQGALPHLAAVLPRCGAL
jgi:hypothetical protein